jgi:hypothetical protein
MAVVGPLSRKVRRVSLSFFSFLFQTLFKSNFSFQIQTRIFQTILQYFIKFLEATQATKNHANLNDDAQPLIFSIIIKLRLIF